MCTIKRIWIGKKKGKEKERGNFQNDEKGTKLIDFKNKILPFFCRSDKFDRGTFGCFLHKVWKIRRTFWWTYW